MVKVTGPRGVEEATCRTSGNTLTVTPAATLTAFGEYTLTIAREALLIGDKKSPAYSFKFTIPNPNGEGWKGDFTFNPADEAKVETLKQITVTFGGASNVAVSDIATPNMFPAIYDSEMNLVTRGSAFASGNKLEISLFSEVDMAGYYTLVVSKDFIKVDGSSLPDDLMAAYEVIGKPTAEYTFATYPAEGQAIGYAEPIRITFAGEGLVSVANDPWGASPRLSSADGNYCPTLQITQVDDFTFEWNHTYPFEADGEYTLSIPAKYFSFTYADSHIAQNAAFTIKLVVREFPDEPVAPAETVILDENFDGDYTKTVAYFVDGDEFTPHRSIASIFYSSAAQKYMPWWVARDSDTATDRFFASHSYYTEPAQSDDWLIFRPIEIPTEGFTLSFGAQSLPIRDVANLSDLQVYITESIIDPESMPAAPTFVCEQVPVGKSVEDVEGDWVEYSFSLDAFVGKTVYINFVNRNFDKDILCIDNVRVSRKDVATIVMNPLPELSAAVSLPAKLTVTAASTVTNYSVRLLVDGAEKQVWNGNRIAVGQSIVCEADVALTKDAAVAIGFEFNCDEIDWPMTASQSVTGMLFEPVHRVMIEETTSLYCGNCPMAMYVAEEMLNDEQFAGRFIPVGVHIAAMGFDPMATPDYYNNLPFNGQAPLVFTDRATAYDGFTMQDLDYDPTNEATFPYRIAQRINAPTYLDVDVSGEWVIKNNDTIAVKCHAVVRPAISLKEKDLRVAFILTENNVGLDMNEYWVQTNYLHDAVGENRYGGWGDLGEFVINARYHDVARAISAYDGHPRSLPADLAAGQEYTFDYTLEIPETYNKNNGRLLADHIQRQFCNISAIVIDTDTERVVNSARYPMSDVTENRYTVRQLVESGIEEILADPDVDPSTPVIYYDLQGRRISEPTAPGLYIRRHGPRAEKVML